MMLQINFNDNTPVDFPGDISHVDNDANDENDNKDEMVRNSQRNT